MIAAWHVAFRGGYWRGHCLAFGFDAPAGVWTVVDPTRTHIEIESMAPAEFDVWIRDIAIDHTIYLIDCAWETGLLCPGLWCVGTVKRLIGLRSSALSPGGLRRDIVRAGAVRAFHRCT